ncbi:hypothetical protein JGS22_017485 [Streptomyces sp. P38-E01]|uniref:SPOR domain-containing protein n=1 Tax=Streptomyces tardus TaxID=2780544 RepID=A0A949N9Y5_9ACTN|nr:hypothetical protein [Streptomyces tardus]MBU7599358.1 hypothetical protein [Streptomyces tardus]
MALFQRKTTGKPGEWYYCLKHRKVEEGPECPAKDRLGPYESREEAAQAVQIAHERNVKWSNDPRWQEPEPEPGSGEPGESPGGGSGEAPGGGGR